MGTARECTKLLSGKRVEAAKKGCRLARRNDLGLPEVMKVEARRWVVCLAVVAALMTGPEMARAQRMVREGRIERMIIVDGESKDGWSVTEATLELTSKVARSGRSLLFHIPVDWHGGEPKYPIGWPRCWWQVPEGARDWRGWELLRMWIYADTSRDELPSRPLGFILSTAAGKSSWSKDLDGVAKGKWKQFSFSLDGVPGREEVVSIKFFISESRYRHGDIVDFYIDDLELVRYTKPTLVSLEPVSRVYFADDTAMAVKMDVLGLEPGKEATARIALLKKGKTVASGACRVLRGRNFVTLRLPPGLKAGEYEVCGEMEGQKLTARVRLVESPWGGGK